jgi:8-oxo-dGTP pyrophosphatase MutT (NUDIX family)
MATEQPILAAGGVVYAYDTTRTVYLLLIQDKHNIWTLPKGHIEAGENEEETAIREIAEEAGITCTVERLLQRVSYPVYKNGNWRDKQVTYFLASAELVEPTPRLDEGIRAAAWFTPAQALPLLGYAQVREVVRRAIDALK